MPTGTQPIKNRTTVSILAVIVSIFIKATSAQRTPTVKMERMYILFKGFCVNLSLLINSEPIKMPMPEAAIRKL